MSSDPDVIVVGSGPNGLVAACVLARRGHRVLVLEAHPSRPGGAVGSDQATLPGFTHDVGAAFFPFGRSSPAFRALDLAAHGVEWLVAPIESAHPAPDGTTACICRNPNVGVHLFGSPSDNARWRALAQWYRRVEPDVLEVLLGPVLSLGPIARLGPIDTLRMATLFASTGRALACRFFETPQARRVLPSLAMHADLGPDDPLGAGIGVLLGLVATTGGFMVPRGGARSVANALIRILEQMGGRLQLSSEVLRVIVRDGRARAVALGSGEELAATRAIVADTAVSALLLDLVARRHVPERLVRAMKRYPYGWGTFKMDWALGRAVPWATEPTRQSAVVHAADDLDDLARVACEIRAGRLPDRPYLVIGQQSLFDPSRAPAGQQTLWAYSRVPPSLPGGWAAVRESFADRIEERIEGLAPGFRSHILARRIQSPDDLQAMNANLVGGDIGGGSSSWRNQLVLRPAFPYFRYRMPIARLYLCSSYAHPGGGVHGMCGYNAAATVARDIEG